MRPSVRAYLLPIGMLASLASVGCAGTQPAACEYTETVLLRVHPANHLNPDRSGLPRSVVLRVFQVDEPSGFATASFERIWATETGPAAPDRVIALPGRSQMHALRRDPDARYLALAANFRERTDAQSWRGVVRLPAPHDPCEEWPVERTEPVEVVLRDYVLELPNATRNGGSAGGPSARGATELFDSASETADEARRFRSEVPDSDLSPPSVPDNDFQTPSLPDF